jgi:phosphoribosyl-ATP pyrophosphohydrolase
MTEFTLADLAKIVAARARTKDAAASYTATLLADGIGRCAKKFGEEAVETIIAALGEDRQKVVAESADLIYHWLVVLAIAGVPLADVMAELERRTGQSGVAEKAARPKD